MVKLIHLLNYYFKFRYIHFLLCMIHVHMYTKCMLGAYEVQKKVPYPLEIELWVAVNHHVGVGTEPRSSGRASSTLNC